MNKPKMEPVYAATYEELYQKRQYLNVGDIMNLFGVGKDKAYDIIKAIKSVSDIAQIAGRVTVSDYAAWYNQHLPQGATNAQ